MHRLIFSCVSCFLTCFNGCWFWWWVCVVRKSTIATPSHILLVTGQWVPSYDPTTHHRSIWSREWPVLWEGRTSHVISSNLVWSLCRSVWETLYWSVWCSVPEGGNPCNDVLPRLTISSGQVPLLLSAIIIINTALYQWILNFHTLTCKSNCPSLFLHFLPSLVHPVYDNLSG